MSVGRQIAYSGLQSVTAGGAVVATDVLYQKEPLNMNVLLRGGLETGGVWFSSGVNRIVLGSMVSSPQKLALELYSLPVFAGLLFAVGAKLCGVPSVNGFLTDLIIGTGSAAASGYLLMPAAQPLMA